MPERHEIQESTENKPEINDLFSAKEAFFQDIEERLAEIKSNKPDNEVSIARQTLVNRMFQYSVSDALRLIKRLNDNGWYFGPSFVRHTIESPEFVMKHEEIANTIDDELHRKREFMTAAEKEIAEHIQKMHQKFSNQYGNMYDQIVSYDELVTNIRRPFQPATPEAKMLAREIDKYYENVARGLTFENFKDVWEEYTDGYTHDERIGLRFLRKNRDALENDYQRLDVVFNEERKLAKDLLEKELNKTLGEKNLELSFDPVQKKYSVKKKEQPETPEGTKEIKSFSYEIPKGFEAVQLVYKEKDRHVFLVKSLTGGYALSFEGKSPVPLEGDPRDWSDARGKFPVCLEDDLVVYTFKHPSTGEYFINSEICLQKEGYPLIGAYKNVDSIQKIGDQIVCNVVDTDGEANLYDAIGNKLSPYGFERIAGVKEINGQLSFIGTQMRMDKEGNEVPRDYLFYKDPGADLWKYIEADRITDSAQAIDGFVLKGRENANQFITRVSSSGQIATMQNLHYVSDFHEAGGDQHAYVVDRNNESFIFRSKIPKHWKSEAFNGPLLVRRENIRTPNGEFLFLNQKADQEKDQIIAEGDIFETPGVTFDAIRREDKLVCLTGENGFLHEVEFDPITREPKKIRPLVDLGANKRIVFKDGSSMPIEFMYNAFALPEGNMFFADKKDGQYLITDDKKEFGPFQIIHSRSFIDGISVFALSDAEGNESIIASGEQSSWFQRIYDKYVKDGVLWVVGERGSKIIHEPLGTGSQSKEEPEMNASEEEKLHILNAVAGDQTPENLEAFFNDEEYKISVNLDEKILEREYTTSNLIKTKFLDHLAKVAPEGLLRTIGVSTDSLPQHKAKQILAMIFPNLYQREEQRSWRSRMRGMFGGGRGESSLFDDAHYMPAASDYLFPERSGLLSGGNPRIFERGIQPEEVMRFRENTGDAMILTGIYGAYSKQDARWTEMTTPVDRIGNEETLETTITLPNIGRLQEIILPVPLNARVIKERVKGIKKDGSEIDLETTIDTAGRTFAKTKNNIEQVMYSVEYSIEPRIVPETTNKQYETFKQQFVERKEKELGEKIGDLPVEIKAFVHSLEKQSPKEKMIAIESFVRKHMYYDFDNGEVADLKHKKSLEEQLMIMQERMDHLKEKNKELAEQAPHKQYAGVCADSALLTTAMLREAGLLSGALIGFRQKGKSVTTQNAHGASFVLFPDPDTGIKMFEVDGTPTGVTEAEQQRLEELGITTPSLEEKEQAEQEKAIEFKERAKEAFQEMRRELEELTPEKIRELGNGRLENVLNAVLRYEVQEEHAIGLKRLLESYWYTPLKDQDLEAVENKVALMKYFESEISRAKNEGAEPEALLRKKPGSYLFETVNEFIKRMEKEMEPDEAYATIRSIEQAAGSALNETEKRALEVITTYLEAKHIKGR